MSFFRSSQFAVVVLAAAFPLATTPLSAQQLDPSGLDAARAHAAPYGNPDFYIQPAVVDIYQDFFLGRPTSQSNVNYNTGDGGTSYAAERQTVTCYAGNCAPPSPGRPEICASAYNGSFLPIRAGDTVYIGKIGVDWAPAGNTPDGTRARTHAVVQVSPGTGPGDCPAGTSILTVYPYIDYVAEGVGNGASLSPVWRDAVHPTDGAAYLIGYGLGSDSRDKWGAQGRNLIANPGFHGDANGTVPGWAITWGTMGCYPYDIGNGSTAPSPGARCSSGEGVGYPSGTPGRDCVATSGTEDAEVVQSTSVPVAPGEHYILSGLIATGSDVAYYGLADDRNGDGVWTVNDDMKVTLTDAQAKTSMAVSPRWFSQVVTIPDDVVAVKFLYHVAEASDWLDFVSMRGQTGAFDSNVTTNYLLNDPGARNIVFMGDSWFDPGQFTPYATYFKQGLLDAFAARGISIPPGHLVFTGTGGDTSGTILSKLPAVLAAYQPLYVVLDGGINDAFQGTLLATTMVNLKEMARLSVQAGAIPIFLSPPPGAKLSGSPVFGSGSQFAALHALREGLRNWALGLDGIGCSSSLETVFLTCGTGACARAVPACVGSVPQICSPGATQSEICNGVDDDCNGVVDDGGDALCSDTNDCTTDTCEGGGGCAHANATGPCSDGNACTVGDTCGAGVCSPTGTVACNDSNVCTTDSCIPATGVCAFVANAESCDDDNACTLGDVCSGGGCVAGESVVCVDGNVCTTDSCDPTAGCVFTSNVSPCSDGDPCTSGDTCGGGTCRPGAPSVCDDGNPCTTDSCDPATGACVFANNTNVCSDGNACTIGDVCGGGTCRPGEAAICSDNNTCTTDGCNPATGACVFANNTNACSDGTVCTTGDTCGGGTCHPGTAVVCNDGNGCTTDSCSAVMGCVTTNNTNACSDGNACTTGDTCGGGTCNPGMPKTCNDNNVCTTDSCNTGSGACVFANNTRSCNDGNACTTGDTCSGGACNSGSAVLCNDNNVCTTDSCVPATGCVFANNIGSCSDGNACTTGDVCGAGTCHAGSATVCNDNNPCTTDSCNPSAGCVFANNVSACNDGSACTAGDVCAGGTCVPGTATVCNDGNVCTTDSCNPATGACVFSNNAGACSDGNPCTVGDTCGGGACNAGPPTVCNDSNACTTESCSPTTGFCVYTNNTNTCSDGNVCTTGDACSGGSCQPGPPTVCNDNNPCTDDTCNVLTGCKFTNDNTNACSDGSVCTATDFCQNGVCRSGTAVTCNDSNPCTTDSCDPVAGCVFANNTSPCDDGSACTQNDVCEAGSCAGVPMAAPLEVGNGVRIDRSGSNRVISWSLATNATSSDLLRGRLSGLPVGPGGGDEVCFGNVVPTTMIDNAAPPTNNGFWYLVRGANACAAKGSWGSEEAHGVAGTLRSSATCP